MSLSLLDRTRKLGRLLHNNTSPKVAFNDICGVLSDSLQSVVLVISRGGKLLGCGISEEVAPLKELLSHTIGEHIDDRLNERFMGILSTQDNVNLMTLGFSMDVAEGGGRYHAVASPIYAGGERLGSLFIYKDKGWYDMDDIILAEYAGTVVGLELLRSLQSEADESDRLKQGVKSALDALTLSEKEAIRYILKLLNEEENILVAKRVAEDTGIARSVVVNALRKLESAGIIETHSAGVKGTRLRVINNTIYDLI